MVVAKLGLFFSLSVTSSIKYQTQNICFCPPFSVKSTENKNSRKRTGLPGRLDGIRVRLELVEGQGRGGGMVLGRWC